jgi:serine/threonine protein kinase
MGVVWRAWLFYAPTAIRPADPPQPLALKVLRPQVADQPAMRAQFAGEADALRALRHPNIVAFHDFFEWGGSLALAMELVTGSTLEGLISRHRARAREAGASGRPGVPVARAWYYFQQLLGALAATHAMGIVHRDVKPANVLIRGDGIVKLSDYGVARLVQAMPAAPPAVPASSALAMSTAVGTGAYMSPEQVLQLPVDGRSDLYSAAIVFYEMLAGRPPFSSDEKDELTLRQDQVETGPPPLRTFVPDAPPSLEEALARALAKNPRYRFASALELGNALRVALGERDTPEWRAQGEIADQAAVLREPSGRGAREAKLRTLQEFVVNGYRASNPVR